MISIRNVSFGYGDGPGNLKQLNLEITPGECILLCGTSGCGKTTVTKLINGLIPHFSPESFLTGEVYAADLKIKEAALYEIAKHVGSVFQNPKSQFFNMDADSELAFGLENEGADRAYIKKQIEKTIQQLEIRQLIGRGIFAMSGGEKQMLAFASVYAMNPDIFVLDEPTANLDIEAIEKIRRQLKMLKEQGKTIIIAEHRLYFLTDLIDRAIYIKDGYLEKVFSQAEFCSLSIDERKELGLRSLTNTCISLPAASLAGDNGLLVKDVTFSFKKRTPVLERVTFAVTSGEVLAVTGKNGAGKTTLIKVLCGLLKESGGKIFLNQQVLSCKERQKLSFCVMQDVNHQLFSDSVWGECELSNSDASESDIKTILESLHLLGYKDQHPMALSGGQKQRLAIATALLSEKKIMIFDEPTSGLDYGQMTNVVKIIQQLKQQGKIILIVSHDKEFISAVCDRVLTV